MFIVPRWSFIFPKFYFQRYLFTRMATGCLSPEPDGYVSDDSMAHILDELNLSEDDDVEHAGQTYSLVQSSGTPSVSAVPMPMPLSYASAVRISKPPEKPEPLASLQIPGPIAPQAESLPVANASVKIVVRKDSESQPGGTAPKFVEVSNIPKSATRDEVYEAIWKFGSIKRYEYHRKLGKAIVLFHNGKQRRTFLAAKNWNPFRGAQPPLIRLLEQPVKSADVEPAAKKTPDPKHCAERQGSLLNKAAAESYASLNELIISNIPESTDRGTMFAVFSKYGKILSLAKEAESKVRVAFDEWKPIHDLLAAGASLKWHPFASPTPLKVELSAESRRSLQLFVEGIAKSVSEAELREVFQEFGSLKRPSSVNLCSGTEFNSAYVTYAQPDAVKNALVYASDNTISVGGKIVKIRIYEPKPEEKPGGYHSPVSQPLLANQKGASEVLHISANQNRAAGASKGPANQNRASEPPDIPSNPNRVFEILQVSSANQTRATATADGSANQNQALEAPNIPIPANQNGAAEITSASASQDQAWITSKKSRKCSSGSVSRSSSVSPTKSMKSDKGYAGLVPVRKTEAQPPAKSKVSSPSKLSKPRDSNNNSAASKVIFAPAKPIATVSEKDHLAQECSPQKNASALGPATHDPISANPVQAQTSRALISASQIQAPQTSGLVAAALKANMCKQVAVSQSQAHASRDSMPTNQVQASVSGASGFNSGPRFAATIKRKSAPLALVQQVVEVPPPSPDILASAIFSTVFTGASNQIAPAPVTQPLLSNQNRRASAIPIISTYQNAGTTMADFWANQNGTSPIPNGSANQNGAFADVGSHVAASASPSPTPTMLQVRNVSRLSTADILLLFLQSKRSGGGPVKSSRLERFWNWAVVDFHDISDATRVLRQNHQAGHWLENIPLFISAVPPVSQCHVLMTEIPLATTFEHLCLYLEARSKLDVDWAGSRRSTCNSRALFRFQTGPAGAVDFPQLVEAVTAKPMKGLQEGDSAVWVPKLERVPATDAVRVSNLPAHVRTEDALVACVLSLAAVAAAEREGVNTNIQTVCLDLAGAEALVVFEDYKAAEKLSGETLVPIQGGEYIFIQPYFDCVDEFAFP